MITDTDAADLSRDETDVDGLEVEQEDTQEIEVPFDPTKIDIVDRKMSISTLLSRLKNSELDLTPDFQRHANVWDAKRKSRLVESVLLRIPLPSFYFSEDEHGTYSVVDGLQRLCAIFHFADKDALEAATQSNLRPLKLENLQYLKELEGLIYSQLERRFQRRISELEISANVIRASTPSPVKFNVFARLNQGGVALTSQEIRNAIFPGAWRNRIRQLASCEEFLHATGGKIRPERQQDTELVLRFVANWALGAPYHRQPRQTLDEFLNGTVENVIGSWGESKWEEASSAFKASLLVATDVLGPHRFRKFGEGARVPPINRSLFEAQTVAFSGLRKSQVEQLLARSGEFTERLRGLLSNDPKMYRALLYATGSGESSNYRIDSLRKLIAEFVDA